MARLIVFVVIVLSMTFWAKSQSMSGDYTIDPTLPPSPTNFQTFDAAINALNTSTVAGPITFKVKAGAVFNERIRAITNTGTETKPIKFIKNGTGANPKIVTSGTASTEDAGIYVKHGNYFTFESIDIAVDDDSVEYGFLFKSINYGTLNNNTIRNCNIVLSVNKIDSLSRGIAFINTTIQSTCNNNIIDNVTIQKSFCGIEFKSSYDNIGQNNTIINCSLTNLGRNTYTSTPMPVYGIVFEFQMGFVIQNVTISQLTGNGFVAGIRTGQVPNNGYTIKNCTISDIQSTGDLSCSQGINSYQGRYAIIENNTIFNIINNSTNTNYTNAGIEITSYLNDSVVISKNKIYNISTTSSIGRSVGISVSNISKCYVINNMVAGCYSPNVTNNYGLKSLYFGGNTNAYIWHNSVYMDGTITTSNGGSTLIFLAISTGYSVELKNNIFINITDVSASSKECIVFSKTVETQIANTTNNNIYYAGVPGPKNILVSHGTTKYYTLQQYKAAVPYDQNSLTELTPFVNTASPFDLHIKTTHCSAANNNGVFIPAVTTDYDGNPRNTTTPDIGADELDGMPALYANAGEDQTICVNYTTLTANNPALQNASGIWSTAEGSGSFSNPQSYQVSVTNISSGLNKYVWSVTKPNCATARDTVAVLNARVVADASVDFSVCYNIATLNGNDPTQYYQATGLWTVVSGSGTFSNPSSPNTQVTDLAIGPNTYRWTVSNAHCSAYDDVVVTNNSVTADAGQDQTICQNSTQLSANTPVTGATGMWSILSGSGTFVNPNSPTTQFTNIGLGNNYLRWTVTKANCNAYDDVTINNRMVVANAGPDTFICYNYINLYANNPGQYGATGQWTISSGSLYTQIHNPSSPTSYVSNLGQGNTTLRWYVTNGTCSADDEVAIWNMSNDANFTYSINGLTVTFNNNSTQYPPYVYTYTWNFGDGTEITQNSYIPTTEHTYSSAGTYTVTLTVQGSHCSDQHSEQIVLTSLGNINQTTKIFPNPAKNSITIDNSLSVEVISIYDSQGKLLMSMKPKGSKTQIDISHLAAGVYYLKLSGKDTTTVHKIIKN